MITDIHTFTYLYILCNIILSYKQTVTCVNSIIRTLVKRQKDLTTSHLHTQLNPFASDDVYKLNTTVRDISKTGSNRHLEFRRKILVQNAVHNFVYFTQPKVESTNPKTD